MGHPADLTIDDGTMNDSTASQDNLSNAEFSRRVRRFADILNPLFAQQNTNSTSTLFEQVCTLVRAGGLKDTGWDSYSESKSLLDDLSRLMTRVENDNAFLNWEDTQARLALLSYGHMIEMNLPYELIVNLLRVRCGEQYCMEPFAHLGRKVIRNINGVKYVVDVVPASPLSKMKEIQKWADKCGMSDVGVALSGIYDNVIRNAFFHSDYVIHNKSMRLLAASRYSSAEGCNTPLISFDELADLTRNAFAFHSSLRMLYDRQRRLWIGFRSKFLPFDSYYKGVIEFTFEDGTLNGFRVYWPNGTVGIFGRQQLGACYAQNLRFRPNGSIDFMVGIIAARPGAFSPLVEADEAPHYAEVPGETLDRTGLKQ